MNTILAARNCHVRDANIRFYARGHKYEILTDTKSKYTSVTTWNHSHFPKFDADAVIASIFRGKSWAPGHKYWGLDAEQIKAQWKSNGDAVSGAGTKLHERIETFMNDERFQFNYSNEDLYDDYKYGLTNSNQECAEWQYFLQFVRDHPKLKPYRTEWMIYDEDVKIAGSIDMVYKNPDGSISIYDWKRSKDITKVNGWDKFAINPIICHLPDANFWHYALQLNTYKTILEQKYGFVVSSLHLVRLHPDADNQSYELIDVPIMATELTQLFEERKNNLKIT